MPYLQSNIPHFKCWVRREYTCNHLRYHGEFLHGMAVAVTTMPNRCLSFQIIFTGCEADDTDNPNVHGGAMWANRVDDFYAIHRHIKHAIDWNLTELHIDKIKDYDTGGQITRGDDAPKLKFWNKADFVGSDEVSPLKEWRMYFFGEGKQTHLETLMTIPDEDEDENDVPF